MKLVIAIKRVFCLKFAEKQNTFMATSRNNLSTIWIFFSDFTKYLHRILMFDGTCRKVIKSFNWYHEVI